MEGAKRPFWMHQLVEYLLGAALLSYGVRTPTPAVPAVAGGLIVLHAAVTRGPLSAFRGIPRRLHRVIDLGIIAVEVVAAIQPVVSVEGSARGVIAAIAAVHLFVWWQTSYTERVPRAARPKPVGDADRATEIGRTAGRLVGTGVNAVRKRQRR